MQFGLWIDARNPTRWRREPAHHFAELLERAEQLEALDWDTLWLSEQVFVGDGESAASLPLAAAVAARTERLRIGTGVLPLPFLNPVRVAEDAATLDVLSGGRFDLGVGLGARNATPPGADDPIRERGPRVDESIEIVRRLLSGERLDYDGTYFSYADLEVHPRPLQHPVPVWVGGASAGAARRAGAIADGFLGVGDMRASVEQIARSAEAQGRDPAAITIAGGLPRLMVTRDPDTRFREAREHFDYQSRIYSDWFAELGLAPVEMSDAPPILTPEAAVEQVARYCREQHVTHYLSFGAPPGLPREWTDEHLELMTREVIPTLR